jgi:two-component system OmpR family sensor kinase
MSLQHRVILGCAVTAVVLFVADVALASTFRTYLLSRLDDQLMAAAVRVADAPEGPSPEGPPAGGPPPQSENSAFSEYFIGRANDAGEIVERLGDPLSRQAEAIPEPDPETVVAQAAASGDRVSAFEAASANGERWRMVALWAPDWESTPIVVVGGSLAVIDATYGRMVFVLAVATAAVLAALSTVFWWVLRHGVRPLTAMTATAGAIADGALSARVAGTDPRTEAGRLGDALNTMLGRIEDAFRERTASQERLRDFVANASHELRTPLTSVRGYAELYRAGALTEQAALDDAMRRVEQEASRMGDLVEDLLLLARLDEGRPLEQRSVRLNELVSDAVRDAQAVEPDRPISCAAEPVEIVGDEATLRQAVGNLLANARAHTPPDTGVEVSVHGDGPWAIVEVTDHGPGMPADVADHVFERFFRADPARSRARGGSGLGLSIVASIAEAHNGTVAVASAPGAGARFRLRLPRPDVAA